MNHNDKLIKAVVYGITPYLSFFIFWVIYSAFVLHSDFYNVHSDNFVEKFLTPSLFISFIMLIIFYFKISLLFSRLDNILYVPNSTHYTVSGEKYIKSNFSLIVWILIFSIILFLIIFSNTALNIIFQVSIIITCTFLSVVLLRLTLKKISIWLASIVCSIPLAFILVFSYLNSSFKDQLVNWTVVVFLAALIISIIISLVKLPEIAKKFMDFVIYTLFSEFYVADQSKKYNQNIEILSYLFENLTKKKKESLKELNESLKKFKKLLKLLKRYKTELFLKYYDDKSRKESTFLDLSSAQEFNIFINRLKENINKDFESLILELENEYLLNESSYKYRIMKSRTNSIKLRNNCNLALSLFFLLITILFMVLINYYIFKYKMLIFLILITPIFLRLVLRGFEIGRSFYMDLTTSKYPESFLTGTDRITLAIKSILEIVFLSSSIYLLCSLFECGWSLKFDEIAKIILHAFSVSMFNISYSDEDGILLIYQLTHVIQVVISLILITIGISGYMTRIKYPVYFENVLENDIYKIVQHTLFINNTKKAKQSEDNLYDIVSKTIIDRDISNGEYKEKKDFIIDEIEKRYESGNINDEEYYHFINLIFNKYAVGERIHIDKNREN
ncbi:hypothetical protein [Exiguobacterium sp. H66]|uniref:hypothetical protein n=1 Tax=Exiguobacterium sp. H66 TaxID=2751208 RepID=UPI001BE7FC58|nr:hypothetical protein [Exiguobacterium sp. H66]